MALTKEIKQLRAEINRANAKKSTGPRTIEGKQRSCMNACKHNLTGFNLIMQADELETYKQLSATIASDLKPATELERQTVQKIADTHFRLNRISGLENNIFNFGLIANETQTPNDDRIEVMLAQTRAWIERSGSFDVLGRYEARLLRQLLQITLELERLQTGRKAAAKLESTPLPKQTEADNIDLASFGRIAPEFVMSADSHRVSTPGPLPQPAFDSDLTPCHTPLPQISG
jgi:hypothetical protein